MINGLQGIPGSGKSYEAAVFQVLQALKQGRMVITNLPLVVTAYGAIDPAYASLIELRYAASPVRGVWDAEGIDPETGQGEAFKLFEDGHVEPAREGANRFGTVWCYYSPWKHPKTGQGPLFVIDECHVAMPKIGTDKAVAEYYKLHRHFNHDILLATQNFRQMSQDIAELMAMVIKVRKADILGRSDEYIRKVHAGYRGAVIQESVRKYEPHFFTLYKSHTQGNSVLEAGATDVAPLSVKIKRWTRAMWGVAACGVAFAVWFNTRTPDNSPGFKGAYVKADGKTDLERLKRDLDPPAKGVVEAPGKTVKEVAPVEPALPEPYAGKSLHLTGMVRMSGRIVYTFAVAISGAVQTQLTSDELVKVGYQWNPRSDCVGFLAWGKDVRAVVCDAPVRQSGAPDKPVVLYGHGPGSAPAAAVDAKPAGLTAM